jgi:Zn-dependent metalloprotease
VRKAFDGLTEDGPGIGVKGDVKQLDTSVTAGTNVLVSSDGREATYDGRNRFLIPLLFPGRLFADADDVWNLAGRESPGQPAGVDAHYYANVTDDFYRSVFGRDSINGAGGQIVSTTHFLRNYNNAFWNGAKMTYGDGDGVTFREFSGALDVVAHELTHGVTDFTSNLVYLNEPGALNEAFSDMMGTTAEFYAGAGGLDPAASPDWQIGEDIYLAPDAVPGFRNLADPQEDGDPDHYSERFLGTADNGGVHTNSMIPGHAYALLVNGGRNAGCDAIGSNGHSHTADCDVVVGGVGIEAARQVFYTGFTSLNSTANFCAARNATVAASPLAIRPSVSDAWAAVGVHAGC